MRLGTILTAATILAATFACKEKPSPDLAARAKITEETARTIALAKVPGGAVVSGELEEEGGKLIWSFDIRVEGRPGIEEVHVDAISGAVIAQEHEGASEEATEKREERDTVPR